MPHDPPESSSPPLLLPLPELLPTPPELPELLPVSPEPLPELLPLLDPVFPGAPASSPKPLLSESPDPQAAKNAAARRYAGIVRSETTLILDSSFGHGARRHWHRVGCSYSRFPWSGQLMTPHPKRE